MTARTFHISVTVTTNDTHLEAALRQTLEQTPQLAEQASEEEHRQFNINGFLCATLNGLYDACGESLPLLVPGQEFSCVVGHKSGEASTVHVEVRLGADEVLQ